MSTAGGHWKNLTEAQKLTQATLLPGVIEEDIKRNNPLMRTPVAQAANTGSSIKWVRESTTCEDAATTAAVGGQTVWTEDVEYTSVEETLGITYLQRKLDKFVAEIYGNFNNYEVQMLKEMKKGVMRKLGKLFFYGDTTYGASTEFDGLHALAGDNTDTTNLNIDGGETALSLHSLRLLIDAMKYGVDEIWVPPCIGRRFDEAYEEAGFASLAYNSAGNLTSITRTMDDVGRPMYRFNGIPIIRTDYLEQETLNTCLTGTSKRTTSSSGGGYSLFAIKWGVAGLNEADPGVKFAFGNTDAQGDFFTLEYFEKLESYIGKGMRLTNFGAVLVGSSLCLGRIADITDASITA